MALARTLGTGGQEKGTEIHSGSAIADEHSLPGVTFPDPCLEEASSAVDRAHAVAMAMRRQRKVWATASRVSRRMRLQATNRQVLGEIRVTARAAAVGRASGKSCLEICPETELRCMYSLAGAVFRI